MTVYLVSFSLAFLFAFLASQFKQNQQDFSGKSKFFFVLCFVLIFLAFEIPAAIRYDVGTDYSYTYMPTLTYMMNHEGVIPDYDPLIVIIYQLIYRFNLPVQTFFVLSSIFINLFFVLAIAQDKQGNYWMGVLIYFFNCIYFSSLSNVRQFMGIAVALFGFSLVMNKETVSRYFWCLVCCILAILCHKSCVIYGGVLILFLLFRNNKVARYLSLGLIILSPFISIVLVQLIKHTSYAYFLTSFSSASISEGDFLMALPEVFILYLAYRKSKEHPESLEYRFPLFISALSLVVLVFTTINPNVELFLRGYHFFYVFDILYVPFLMESYREDYSYRKNVQIALFEEENIPVGMNQLTMFRTNIGFGAVIITITFIFLYFACFAFEEILKTMYEVLPYKTIFTKA